MAIPQLTITADTVELSPGGDVVLRHQTWTSYEALLAQRSDKAAIKIRFNADAQEIRLMAPLPNHGKRSAALADFVKSMLRHQNLDWEEYDPIALKRFAKAGVEPDRCFYIANRKAILGKERIDLSVDPPPDLALEVDWTSFTSAEDYQSIGVPELWIYRSQSFQIYVFDGHSYGVSESSPTFPKLPVSQLIPEYVELAWSEGSSVALRQFENMLSQL
ncbi:MAG: Uma2 family endonuclease [Leptolyngbyaceae cyanobacterium]